jgi:hypothetical protein
VVEEEEQERKGRGRVTTGGGAKVGRTEGKLILRGVVVVVLVVVAAVGVVDLGSCAA